MFAFQNAEGVSHFSKKKILQNISIHSIDLLFLKRGICRICIRMYAISKRKVQHPPLFLKRAEQKHIPTLTLIRMAGAYMTS
jgi:hypothetical protein